MRRVTPLHIETKVAQSGRDAPLRNVNRRVAFTCDSKIRAFCQHVFLGTLICLPAYSSERFAAPAMPSYERDHVHIDYSASARRNAVAQSNVVNETATNLSVHPTRGYLDEVLKDFEIDPASQVLVFSKTSLQAAHISSQQPRAIYFNDSTYVAWVQGSDHMEVLTIDDDRGPVFFNVYNAPPKSLQFKRESMMCLACHDSASLQPGGVPLVLVRSSRVEGEMSPAGRVAPVQVTHATALEDRWGGWYVTGTLGVQLHLGNMPLAGPPDPTVRHINNRINLDSLASYIDTRPYFSDKSDVIALLVLEHQAHVQNLITRVKYAVAKRKDLRESNLSWAELTADQQQALLTDLTGLATAVTFEDERRLLGRIRSNSSFRSRFEARGPVDSHGRSLREFDLNTRMFRYPISYLVYSSAFQTLPRYAREYVYRHAMTLAESNSGHAELKQSRSAAVELLKGTLDDFAMVSTKRTRVQ